MAIIRTSVNFTAFDKILNVRTDRNPVEESSYKIEPYPDSWLFTLGVEGDPPFGGSLDFYFSGTGINEDLSKNIKQIDGPDFSIEEISISKDQVSNALGYGSYFATLLPEIFKGDDVVYLDGGSISTFEGRDKIYIMSVDAKIDSGPGDDLIYTMSLDASIDAGSGNDLIDTSGAQINDRALTGQIIGGIGDDTYILKYVEWSVVEYSNEGIDTIRISDSRIGRKYYLPDNVENCTMINTVDGAVVGNILSNFLTGNKASNRLLGSAGNDVLYGLGGADVLHGGRDNDVLFGGAGRDTLSGGAGRDTFVFDAAVGAANIDTVTDFNSIEQDKIQLSRTVFSGLTQTGALTESQFYAGAGAKKAHDSSDRIIYDTNTGIIYYDPDGIKGLPAFSFAILGTMTHPMIAFSDFQIIA